MDEQAPQLLIELIEGDVSHRLTPRQLFDLLGEPLVTLRP